MSGLKSRGVSVLDPLDRTLGRRAWYGGRKGRRALRRLLATGTNFYPDTYAPPSAVHAGKDGHIDLPCWWRGPK